MSRLSGIEPELSGAEQEYLLLGAVAALSLVTPSDNVCGAVTSAEMIGLYDGPFRRKGTRARAVYDQLKQGAIHGICPLCGAQQVKTLDHVLAKSVYPSLALTPCNLVPCCSDCNRAKLDYFAETDEEQPIHPYFDSIDDEQWLFARVIEEPPASLLYYCDPPELWPSQKRSRVSLHFKMLGLSTLFASQSGDHLPSMRHRLARLLASSGSQGVREHLEEELADLRLDRLNSWQIALYGALAASDWYCEGGFAA